MKAVTLTADEIDQGVALGISRHQAARKGGRPDLLVTDTPALEIDIISMCAEIAVAKLFRVPFDDYIVPTGEQLPPHDLIVDGLSVDVKNTTLRQGNLIVPGWKKLDHIAYLLSRGTPPTFEIIGYKLGRDIQAKRMFPSGNCWFVHADDLIPVERLLKGGSK